MTHLVNASLITDASVTPIGLAEADAAIMIPFASEGRLKVTFCPDEIDRNTVIEAANWIADASIEKQEEAEQVLFAEYLQAIEDGSCDFESAQAQLNWESENTETFDSPIAAKHASEIWPLVLFHTVHFKYGYSGDIFIDIQAEAAWNGEEGVALRSKNYGPLTIAKGF